MDGRQDGAMPHFTDTHTHPYVPEFDADRAEVMQRALDAGVTRMILPNISVDSIAAMRALAAQWPDNTRMAMGLHPEEFDATNWQARLQDVLDELRRHSGDYIAVGEIGIDLYWDATYEREQMIVFEQQLQLADATALPVIIHCRRGLPQVLEVLERFPALRCDFHCFGGTVDDVRAIRRRGDHYFGINGIVTFKNSGLADVIPEIGLDRILLETDAPYLAPVPRRGRRNEPSYLPYVAAKIADILGTTTSAVAETTARNSVDLFKF